MEDQPLRPGSGNVQGQDQVIPEVDEVLGSNEIANVVLDALLKDLFVDARASYPARSRVAPMMFCISTALSLVDANASWAAAHAMAQAAERCPVSGPWTFAGAG